MPEPLTDAQLAALHDALLALRGELRALLGMSEAGARPVELDTSIGRVSRIDAIQQKEMVAASRQSHQIRLQQVERALAAFDDDAYGECRQCGEDVGHRRLSARPEAPFCLACQGRLERR